MPPAVGRMHPSHMSNPFANLNPQHTIPQSSHYQSQPSQIPSSFSSQPAFGSNVLNGGISPFNPSSAYGGSAFSTGATTSSFNGGVLGGQGQGLASVAAQQGFARGAAMQEHTHQAAAASMGIKGGPNARVREVWKHNLDEEFELLRQVIMKHPYVSMDTEFPGIVARPIGNFAGSKAEYHYQTLRCNVDILKPIQIGMTLWNADGDLPPQQLDPSLKQNSRYQYQNNLMPCPCTWVFNFEFNLDEDMYAESSIELLKSSGVDFQRHFEMGVSHAAFGSLLTTSGLAMMPNVNWLSFHSGYDYGYLIKLLTDNALPKEQHDFFELVSIFFPRLWDIKFLLRHAQRMKSSHALNAPGTRILDSLGAKSGLQDLAEELGCQRVGTAHNAGSDAWLTGSVFWAMRNKIFDGSLDEALADQIYGLHGVPAPASEQYRNEFFAAQGTPQQTNGLSTLQGNAQGYTPNNPSTPTTTHAGLSTQTPGPHFAHGSMGAGGFGNFAYGK